MAAASSLEYLIEKILMKLPAFLFQCAGQVTLPVPSSAIVSIILYVTKLPGPAPMAVIPTTQNLIVKPVSRISCWYIIQT